MSDAKTESSLFSIEPPDESEEVSRLAEAIRLYDRFALFIAACDRANERRRLIDRLREENPDLHIFEIYLTPDIPDLHGYLRDHPIPGRTDAVFAYGLEDYLTGVEGVQRSPFAVAINLHRDSFPAVLAVPLVLWLPEYVRRGLMYGAPDLYSVRSLFFEFASPTTDMERQFTSVLDTGFRAAWAMTPEERKQRITELEDLLKQWEALPSTPRTLQEQSVILERLAGIHHVSGQLNKAEILLRRASEICEQIFGLNHPSTASSLNNLAYVLASQGRYTEALPLFRRALEIYEGTLGSTNLHIAVTSDNLASLLKTQGNYTEAEILYRRALWIREQILGTTHPDTIGTLNNLGILFQYQGNYNEAGSLLRHALDSVEHTKGSTHPDTAMSLNNLAELLRVQGNYAEAEPLYRRALKIYSETMGPTHPNTATILNNLGIVLWIQGNYAEAELLCHRALEIREQALGPLHPDTATTLTNLGVLKYYQGAHAEAEFLIERALTIRKNVLGEKHPKTQESRQALEMTHRASRVA